MENVIYEFVNENLAVRAYEGDPLKAIVIFCSAGARRENIFAEEYKSTLRFTTAIKVFVTDRNISWYNYDETKVVFSALAELLSECNFVCAAGESLGGCGALLFTYFLPTIRRVLCFSPQYSVSPPFVNFDLRYTGELAKIKKFLYPTFGCSLGRDRSILLYGNTEWRDAIHANMYVIDNFSVAFIDGAPHETSRFLKKQGSLKDLFDLLLDETRGFSLEDICRLLGIQAAAPSLQTLHSLSTQMEGDFFFQKRMMAGSSISLPSSDLISFGKGADQSSLSEWSCGLSTQDDAARALRDRPIVPYAFHTAFEYDPWWQVDLGTDYAIAGIEVYNRSNDFEIARRSVYLRIMAFNVESGWIELYRKRDELTFGGSAGVPFTWIPPTPTCAKIIRIQLLGLTCLHFEHVRIYGTRQN